MCVSRCSFLFAFELSEVSHFFPFTFFTLQQMLTDSPTKPLPNYPLSYSDSSIPFLATGLPLDLPILKESNPTATPPLPLETSTPTLLPILVEGSAGSKGSIGRLLAPHGSGNVMKLTGRSSSRGESTEGAIELEEQVSRFLAVEVDMI